MSQRLNLAAKAGALSHDDDSSVLIIGPALDLDTRIFEDAAVTIVQEMMPDADHWASRDVSVVQSVPDQKFKIAIVCVPRAKAAAKDWIARASKCADRVIVDGQKTDGIEAILKEVKRRVDVSTPISKAHGKIFWFDGASFDDWLAAPSTIDPGWIVAPGVFSADGIDPGSAFLVETLPATLSGNVADLGAGWGFLAGSVLKSCPKIKTLHLVEAQASALNCARQNVDDKRAQFHWQDATTWSGASKSDAVIMNPPFHSGRATDLGLGQSFVANASALLRKGGVLWMVANRHLAYEQTLQEYFADVDEVASNNRYKVFKARKGR